MKLIESKAEYIPQEEGLEGIYKMIELAGRTAYHSQDKITPDSAKNFVDRMIKSKHGAALEHGTVYFIAPYYSSKYHRLPYTRIREINGNQYITTNFRVLEEAFDLKEFWGNNIKYLCSPTNYHEKRYTMRFTCSRAIANELVRHRTMSFLQESTRYINYSKERHGAGITFIIPSWIDRNRVPNTEAEIAWLDAMESAEKIYFNMVLGFMHKGMTAEPSKEVLTPQQARDVLPNAVKTELIMTGFASDYKHLFDLRLFGKTGAPHPDMIDLMQKAQKAMQEAGIWEDIMSRPSKFKE